MPLSKAEAQVADSAGTGSSRHDADGQRHKADWRESAGFGCRGAGAAEPAGIKPCDHRTILSHTVEQGRRVIVISLSERWISR